MKLNKMKTNFSCIITLVLLINFKSFSQTNSAPAGNNPALKEAALKIERKVLQNKNQDAASESSPSTNYVGPINENDSYMGKKQEYLNMIAIESLPSDFPQYQKGWSFVQYDGEVEKYFKNHIQILKEVYKAKFQ